ncbi:glycosyltransferase family 1 protein [Faecalicoccus pleomorphus]|uniref:glycosyltransferase family 1 protein n=1 Tax=Faecalicoccus pleomorphus TaxID=1323 RepID=UPI0029429FB9|nr:glycosyltransferase family 1 protein [Faecalicoccus pleomorphus]
MIRILHIVPNMQAGGLETLIMSWYRNIDRSKVQFDFLVHYQGKFFYDDEIERLGGKIYHLSVRDDNNFIKYLHDLDSFFKEHMEYKIVHGHMESLGQFYFRAAKKYGVPVRIAHSHNSATEPTLKGKVKGILAKRFPMYATHCFACSELAGRFMFGDRDFTVIKNAIDLSRFQYDEKIRTEMRAELNLTDKFVIGHVGRFCTQKNHKYLIDVFEQIHKGNSNAILLLIGKGELLEEVKAYVAQKSLSGCVQFLGVRDDVNKLYDAMDVFVFPSIFEGLGIVAIEAQESRLMTVCSDVVPKEANVTEYYKAISLQESPEKWAESICKYANGYEKKDVTDKIRNAGYDIKKSASMLQQFYQGVFTE